MSRLARRQLGKWEKGENRMYLCEVFLFCFFQQNVHKSIAKAVDIFRVAFILLFLFLLLYNSATKAKKF